MTLMWTIMWWRSCDQFSQCYYMVDEVVQQCSVSFTSNCIVIEVDGIRHYRGNT